jgi:hypothetical protein
MALPPSGAASHRYHRPPGKSRPDLAGGLNVDFAVVAERVHPHYRCERDDQPVVEPTMCGMKSSATRPLSSIWTKPPMYSTCALAAV